MQKIILVNYSETCTGNLDCKIMVSVHVAENQHIFGLSYKQKMQEIYLNRAPTLFWI